MHGPTSLKPASHFAMSAVSERVFDGSGHPYSISGSCSPKFSRVLDAFMENFRSGEEVGASVSVVHDGQTVVDLWGGYKDRAKTEDWQADTIVNMMSVAKAFVATSIHILMDRGQLEMDAPVARYWPEFAQAGKADLPVRYLLDHRAGLPVLRPSLPRGALYDWEAITSALAAMAPLWEPGTHAGYHILTQGFLLGELVRRVSGMSVGRFIRSEISQPLGIDYNIGLTPDEASRAAEFLPAVEGTIFKVEELPDEELLKYAWSELPKEEDFNSSQWRHAEIPGANGHGNARAVARFYGCLAMDGEIDGIQIISKTGIERMASESHNMQECVMKRSYHQGFGILLNSPPIIPMGPNPKAFGHHGVGGSVGLADRDAGIGFAYAMNQMHGRVDNGPRAGRLKDATFASL